MENQIKVLKNIKTEKDYKEFIDFLFTKQDLKYRDFNAKVIVIDKENLIGIRIPIIREIAKNMAKNDYINYLKVFENLWRKNKILYFEEKLLYSIIVCNIKEKIEDKLPKIEKMIEFIDTWALCDCALSSAKFVKKNEEIFYNFLISKIDSKNPWELRFVIVSLLEYYTQEKYLEDIFKICEYIKSKEYYVNMAKAWLLSVCYVHFKEETYRFLKNCNLDSWTVNKTVQKIRESLRVSKEDKEKALVLKRS